MDSFPAPSSPPVIKDDDWDTDGFVIPGFRNDDPDHNVTPPTPADTTKSSSPQIPEKEEGIDLGLHGVPSQQKQIEPGPKARKQKLKHKLKEADKRSSGTGRENKMENLRELVGAGTQSSTSNMPKSSPRDWLDPHCHESEFERRPSHSFRREIYVEGSESNNECTLKGPMINHREQVLKLLHLCYEMLRIEIAGHYSHR